MRELPCLSELLKLMVKAGVAEKYDEDDEVEDATAVRELPVVCESSMSQHALDDAIAELKAEQGKLAAEQEDPALVEFEKLYLGKIFRDENVRGKPHYEVVAISYDGKSGGKCWEATVAPVSLSENGVWETPRTFYVAEGGGEMIDPEELQGHVLDLTEPEDRPDDIEHVERPDDVGKMIALHEQQEPLRLSA
jgi:hypothetical protein